MTSILRILLATAVLALGAAVLPTVAQDADIADDVARPEPLAFPRTLTNAAGTVVLHTPQIDTWTDYARIEGRLAVAVTPAEEESPVYGVAEFTADTDPNLELRVVAVENTEITVTSFPVPDVNRREQLHLGRRLGNVQCRRYPAWNQQDRHHAG